MIKDQLIYHSTLDDIAVLSEQVLYNRPFFLVIHGSVMKGCAKYPQDDIDGFLVKKDRLLDEEKQKLSKIISIACSRHGIEPDYYFGPIDVPSLEDMIKEKTFLSTVDHFIVYRIVSGSIYHSNFEAEKIISNLKNMVAEIHGEDGLNRLAEKYYANIYY